MCQRQQLDKRTENSTQGQVLKKGYQIHQILLRVLQFSWMNLSLKTCKINCCLSIKVKNEKLATHEMLFINILDSI